MVGEVEVKDVAFGVCWFSVLMRLSFLACVMLEVEVTQEGCVGMSDGQGGMDNREFINEVLVLPGRPVDEMEGGGLSCKEWEMACCSMELSAICLLRVQDKEVLWMTASIPPFLCARST